ncbi:hypothetical protein [Leptospira andrefontaineae]|uniref:Uncharacterized protein n=1 Tax=Leptospira andrefontaineae TaxID=2484976 RepID=A0A4V3JFK0_9LEPT|nr:hypothetical protein [Leptospira andrefontaineae]TGK37652.1 hypothetical protein EHO65_14135 [Leptospira andrefontaineae]
MNLLTGRKIEFTDYIMISRIIVISFLSFSFAYCKGNTQKSEVNNQDLYAIPKNMIGKLYSNTYDFDINKIPKVIVISPDQHEGYLGTLKANSNHCGLIDLEKGKVFFKMGDVKKDFSFKVIYLGERKLAFIDESNRGYVGYYRYTKGSLGIEGHRFYLYPLSLLNESKIDEEVREINSGAIVSGNYTVSFDAVGDSKYSTLEKCEQEEIKREKGQEQITEELKKLGQDKPATP